MNRKARFAACFIASAMMMMNVSMIGTEAGFTQSRVSVISAAEASVKVLSTVGFGEGMYATWSSVSGANGYNVYVDGVQIDSMLIRQYTGYMRADAVGLKAGSHTMKIVPVINGKEDTSKAAETKADAYAHDRSGFGWVNGTSSGAYNEDGTLKSNALVVYVTDDNKDTLKVDVDSTGKGATEVVGVQNILLAYKKGKESRPLCLRFIGNITDPANMPKGDLMVDTVKAGVTIEGIGNDTVFNGFGLVMKNSSNVEVRNIGFMNCNSSEGDDCGLQQANDHVWVHNCDFFYGDAGSDADQVKGDGALDTKTSTYVTHSYNHFWDNGKCNLQGMKSESTENYITYHHNWYDHSDSRHPRIRTCSVHIYNNYFDGNAKYGVGVTMGASAFVESNYFRNCSNPMLSSLQGTDALGEGTFSGEAGGIIKAFSNIIVGAKSYIPYSKNNTSFDAYEVSSASETVPSSVKTVSGGTTYNNFDTSSLMYNYKTDAAADVPSIVTAKAGRVDGGDLKWSFNNDVDDASYAVNTELKSAIVNYKSSVVAIGSGFKEDNSQPPVVTTQPGVTTQPIQTTTTEVTTVSSEQTTTYVQQGTTIATNVIFCSPSASASGKGTYADPTSVENALSNVKPGGVIWLKGGKYSFSQTIKIEESNSGTAGAYKTISSVPGETAIFDFSSMKVDSANRGVSMEGSYWHWYGVQIQYAGDNGMILSGSNNIIEMCEFNNNQDTGLQISRTNTNYADISQWPSNNLIKNCSAHDNCDDATMENADGFAAKLTCGEGNVFEGCMSYNNSDDGWDLYAKTETGPIGVVTFRNCIAFRNGYTSDGRGYGDCDGNGFKLGGSGVGTAHVLENCVAFENLHHGFTDNNNPKFGSLTNCTSYSNSIGGGKANFQLDRCTSGTFKNLLSYVGPGSCSSDKFNGSVENSVFYNSSKYWKVSSKTSVSNSKAGDNISGPSDSDFKSVKAPAMGSDFHKIWRNADGSINTQGFLEVVSSSSFASMGAVMSNFTSQTSTTLPKYDTSSDTPEVTTTVVETTTSQTVNLYGDVNLDNSIDLTDLTTLALHLLKDIQLEGQALINADVKTDGEVNLADLASLKTKLS